MSASTLLSHLPPPGQLSRPRGWLMIGTMSVLGIAYVAGGGWSSPSSQPGWIELLEVVIWLAIGTTFFWTYRNRWTALTVAPERSAFIVTSPRVTAVSLTTALGLLAIWGSPGPPFAWDARRPWTAWLDLALLVLLGAIAIVSLVRFVLDRPLVEVRPDGVRATGRLRSRLVPWAALSPSTGPDQLALVDGGGIRLHVHGNTLAAVQAAVDHYLAAPQDRPAIGTVEEFQRLLAAGVLST